MSEATCDSCGARLKREFGLATIFAVLITGGIWLLALPFYKKKCACSSVSSGISDLNLTKDNWYKKWQVWAVVTLVIVIVIANKFEPTPTPETPEQIEAKKEDNDRMYAQQNFKRFVEGYLKAPSSAKWQNQFELGAAPTKDKQGKKIKDVWEVWGYVDAQNSFGAMIRQNWYVKMRKDANDWTVLDVKPYK